MIFILNESTEKGEMRKFQNYREGYMILMWLPASYPHFSYSHSVTFSDSVSLTHKLLHSATNRLLMYLNIFLMCDTLWHKLVVVILEKRYPPANIYNSVCFCLWKINWIWLDIGKYGHFSLDFVWCLPVAHNIKHAKILTLSRVISKT